MPLTKVSFSVIQVANNVTSTTVGNTTSIPSFTFDQNGVITSASNVTPSIANTQITGVITGSQIASSVTLTTPIISGNLNLDSAGTTGVRVPSANTIAFHTAGTEDMRITSAGDVGIGTSSPGNKLEVAGLIRATSLTNPSSGSGVELGYDGTQGVLQAFSDRATNTSAPINIQGDLKMNSGYGSSAIAYGCRAWVNFQGTDTVAIRASGNVSSVSDLGTGTYQVNYTNAMPDTNYAVTGTCERSGSDSDNALQAHRTRTTTSVVINTARSGTDLFDMLAPTVAIFR